MLDAAFDGDFSDDDWAHAQGGWHVIVTDGPAVVAHAAVVPRRVQAGERWFDAGYVEAVAVAAPLRRTGLGSSVMRQINRIVESDFDIGVLSTGEHGFYARLGWERWAGPAWVRPPDGQRLRTADDDGGLMILRCEASRQVVVTAPIVCEARAGDAW